VWRSVAIFAFAYAAIVSGRVHKALAAVLGGCVLIAAGAVSQEAAYREIDLNVIFLLLGMMILAHALSETGFFQWVALSLAKATGGDPLKTLMCLAGATALLSAFLDNVTTVLMVGPVTILIADQLELDPVPFLIVEIIASNLGGTATLVGDPPNLLIGSRVGLSFTDFVWNLTPVVLVSTCALCAVMWLMLRRRLHVPDDVRARLRDVTPADAIGDARKTAKVCGVAGFVLVGFFLHDALGLQPSVIALSGAMIVLIVTGQDVNKAFAAVEWPTLMFFAGLFILVAGLQENGVLDAVARSVLRLTRGHFLLTVLAVLWASAAASAIVDNIPFVAAMIPVVTAVIPGIGTQLGLQDPEQIARLVGQPLWWALALGACLGGNATLVGASANVVMAGVAERHGRPVSFMRFTRAGLPATVLTLLICTAYIYVRYFLLAPGP